jgi:hypothetical protein
MSDTDVDFDDADLVDVDENEDVVETAEEPKATKEKKVKEKSKGDLPEGLVTPIGLTHELNRLELGRDRAGEKKVLAPQEVYSSIKNASKDNPYPVQEGVTDSLGKPRANICNLEEGVAWWKARLAGVDARRASAAEKAAKKAENAKKKETKDEPVDEVAEDGIEEFVDA